MAKLHLCSTVPGKYRFSRSFPGPEVTLDTNVLKDDTGADALRSMLRDGWLRFTSRSRRHLFVTFTLSASVACTVKIDGKVLEPGKELTLPHEGLLTQFKLEIGEHSFNGAVVNETY